jgi:cytochrome b561
MNTPKPGTQFALQSRILHWLMVVLLLAMLFIGVSMVASLGDYHTLVAIHRPLGIVILILAAIRLAKPDVHDAAPIPAYHVPSGTIHGFVIREVTLRFDVRPAARGLGHVVGGPLSNRDVRVDSSAADSSG